MTDPANDKAVADVLDLLRHTDMTGNHETLAATIVQAVRNAIVSFEPKTIEELARQQGITPLTFEQLHQRAQELGGSPFDSDDEVDEFIAWVRSERDATVREPRNPDFDQE